MPLILYIHTAIDSASVCLAGNNKAPQQLLNGQQKDHAAWLHPAIKKIMTGAGVTFTDLDAVAVSAGPGSYTGLRVGMAAAKGICYAGHLPLIAINTLEMMAAAVQKEEADFICPAIDARRDEIFCALYNARLEMITAPAAVILGADSFRLHLGKGLVNFTGNANEKIHRQVTHPNARFSAAIATAADMQTLAEKYFTEKKFADPAYAEPYYLKDFFDMRNFSKK
ncbi:MAG TPA: tRNA (adenosine(37)-N6)-threonylcarbamoyltransferase complex dimerization subunit type 1 TsaB [Chitinophagaceae bacterium]|nr:tRNA (adenosine(37)-N6)-threonylcarbamoyltransferase complex dimerization subunit type 1 TsaB [Chitinophagaceae bacterium]